MHVVCELIVTFIEVSMTAGFVLYVLQDHLKTGRSNTMLGAAVIVSMISILDTAFSNTISYLLPFDYTTLTGMVWLLIAYTAISYATEEPRDRVLFLLFLSMNVLLLSRSTTLLIYHVISPELLQGEYTWMDIAGYGIPNIFITSGCAYITSRYYQKLRFIHTSSNHLYLVPLFFYFLAAFQINLYPVDEYVFVLFMKVIVILCAFMTYSQMIQAVINAAKAVQEAEFHKQLSYQLNIENTRISELESHAEEIRHIRHDRRQHVQVLRGLLEHEDIQKALEYLAIMSRVWQKLLNHHFVRILSQIPCAEGMLHWLSSQIFTWKLQWRFHRIQALPAAISLSYWGICGKMQSLLPWTVRMQNVLSACGYKHRRTRYSYACKMATLEKFILKKINFILQKREE